jgi:3-oxoacyl-[acyl-carrier protein] reductase
MLHTKTQPHSRSSTLARLPSPGYLSVYASSKAALESLTRHWAFELAETYNLTANAISIGIIQTDSVSHYTAKERAQLSLLPCAEKRLGVVGDVVPLAAFLASEEARWINGSTISCNGGSLFV